MTKRQKGLWTISRKDRIAIPARSNQLQIDLDSVEALHNHCHYYFLLAREGMTKGWKLDYVTSSTLDHFHVTVTMPRAAPLLERVALQALLGSHLTRECYNWIRAKKGAKMPIVFFREKKR
jgi:hypothetical protein